MVTQTVITPDNLGSEFDMGVAEANKITIKIDGTSLVKAADGTISVDPAGANIVVVSADAGNLLTAGADTGAFLDGAGADFVEAVQDAIGLMVVDATDGLTYDDALNALSSAVASATGTDTSSVDVTASLVDGALDIKADVIVDGAVTGNLLKDTGTGLAVDPADVIAALPATTNVHALTAGTQFDTVVDGVTATTSTVTLTDAFGVQVLGDVLV